MSARARLPKLSKFLYPKPMKTLLFLLVFAVTLTHSTQAFAFRFSPMVAEIELGTKKHTQVFTLENPSEQKVPIQIEVFLRTTNSKGEEVRTKSQDFIIYPEQVVLLPNEKRNVRITWNGEVFAGDEKAYRVIASQVPVEFQESNSQPQQTGVNLNFLLQYIASVYVKPKGAHPAVKLESVEKTGEKSLDLTLFNSGSAHQLIKVKSLKIFAGKKLIYEPKSFPEFENTNLLAKDRKTISLKMTTPLPTEELRAEIEFRESAD